MESWVQRWRPRTNALCDFSTPPVESTVPATKNRCQVMRSAAPVTQNHLRKSTYLMLQNDPCVHSAEKLCPLNRLQTQPYTTKWRLNLNQPPLLQNGLGVFMVDRKPMSVTTKWKRVAVKNHDSLLNGFLKFHSLNLWFPFSGPGHSICRAQVKTTLGISIGFQELTLSKKVWQKHGAEVLNCNRQTYGAAKTI